MAIPWGKLLGAGIGIGSGNPILGATLGGVVDEMFGDKDKKKPPSQFDEAKRAMTKRVLLPRPQAPPPQVMTGPTSLRPTGINAVPYFEQKKKAALQLARS